MATRKPTIFYLDHSNDFSGGQKSLLALLALLDRSRFNPVVIIDHHAEKMAAELSMLKVSFVKINYCNRKWIEYFLVFVPLVRIWMELRRQNPAILHCNTFKSGFIGALISFLTPTPIIFRARLGIIHLSHGIIDKIIFSRSSRILANSFYVKETFTERFGASDKVIVIYNPIDHDIKLSTSAIARLRQTFFYDENVFYFGVIGRIEPFKKLHDVVEAVNLLRKYQGKFKVLFIGAQSKLDLDNYPQQLKSRITALGLETSFEFTGFISEILEATSLLDCLLICSEGEALSRGIYEGQALGYRNAWEPSLPGAAAVGMPTGLMNPLIVIPMMPGVDPTTPGKAG